ncbi:NuA4 histone acetyltransferase subunit [Binucleata daphniae]
MLLPLNKHQKKYQTQIIDYVFNNETESILFVDSMVLDLFSYGKTTGIVIKLGESICVSAVIEGQVRVSREREYGGIEMTHKFIKYINESDEKCKNNETTYSKSQITYFEQMRMLKESVLSTKDDIFEYKNTEYKSEDIKNELIADLCRDIKEHVKEVIEACEIEHKNYLLSNIVLSGGCATIADLSEEITSILCEIYPPSKVKVVFEKSWHTYQGAAVFGSLGSTRCLYIGKKDYEEYGSNILDRKNFL